MQQLFQSCNRVFGVCCRVEGLGENQAKWKGHGNIVILARVWGLRIWEFGLPMPQFTNSSETQ